MAHYGVPTCIQIMQAIASQLPVIELVFNKNSIEYQRLKDLFSQNGSFVSHDGFVSSKYQVGYLQSLMLLGMSMHGGIYLPFVKSFTYKEGSVRIHWDSGVQDNFVFGQFDDHFKRFGDYYRTKVFGHTSSSDVFSSDILVKIINQLKRDSQLLNLCYTHLKPLVKQKRPLISFIDDTISRELLFIILSGLPTDQLNALFIHIQTFFPADLDMRSRDGNKIKIGPFFENPTVDPYYLLEKVIVYFELYFSVNLPIIKEITRSKTHDFLKDILTNTAVERTTRTNIESLVEHQIKARLNLFHLFLKHLEGLLGS